MAGQQYYQQPAQGDPYAQEGYGEEYHDEMDPSAYAEDDNVVLHHMPWMAIALVAHSIALVIAAFIIFEREEPPEQEVLKTEIPEEIVPPVPEEPLKEEVEFPKDEPPVEDPTQDPKIMEDAVDDHNEDPTDQPNKDLAETVSENDSVESPDPRKGNVSNVGFGGGGGGGGAKGGAGGSKFARARGGGGKPKQNHDRTEAALLWLAHHQNPGAGNWDAKHFREHSLRIKRRPDVKVTGNIEFLNTVGADDFGDEHTNVGLTGLALLAFAGDGHTHKTGKFSQTVRQGVKWVNAQQDSDGCFGPRDGDEYMYNHAICAMALAEIYALSLDVRIKRNAQLAVDFIREAQNPDLGWRYGVKPGDNDSSVTAWMVLCLKSAAIGGLDFPAEEIYRGANKWFDLVISKGDDGYLNAGYRGPGMRNARLTSTEHYDRNASMDACAVMVRLFTHHADPADRKEIIPLTRRMLNDLPVWHDEADAQHPEHKIDMYYWYYASLALFQVGGSDWDKWQKALFNPVLLKYQRGWHPKDVEAFGPKVATGGDGEDAGCWMLDEHGSWDPVGAWGSVGGRVYSTAINALTLEVWYRYERISDG